MADLQLTRTDEDQMLLRQVPLQQMLASVLGERRAELHHTHLAPDFREQVEHEIAQLRGLLEK